jgi:16S rRNA (cytidine1402-2'-O)-methyltransferase
LPASLYLVATPIGNLEDISFRAVRVLREEAALIACEDTRQTRKLLDRYEISKPLISYHEHNEEARTADLLVALETGQSVALVSDAGTPLISDPGYRLVCAVIERGFAVVPVPGASAVLAALAASGLPTHEFRFIGFVPQKAGARRKALEALASEFATVIAYESPHRILECLADIAEILGNRRIVLARELTKVHEEFLRGSAETVRQELEKRPSIKGEITLVIARSEEKPDVAEPVAEIERLKREGLERMEAIKTVARRMGLSKRQVYRLVTEQDNNPRDKRRD